MDKVKLENFEVRVNLSKILHVLGRMRTGDGRGGS